MLVNNVTFPLKKKKKAQYKSLFQIIDPAIGTDELPMWPLVIKNSPANAGDVKRHGLDLWVGRIPWRRAWAPTPVFLLGESHGQRSLADYSPLGHIESNTTEAT